MAGYGSQIVMENLRPRDGRLFNYQVAASACVNGQPTAAGYSIQFALPVE